MGRANLKGWHLWVLTGLLAGLVAGVFLVANKGGRFEPSEAARGRDATVISPNGGEQWQIGSSYSINWKFNRGPRKAWVALFLQPTGEFIAQNLPINGSYSWTIPSYSCQGEVCSSPRPTGSDYKVEARLYTGPKLCLWSCPSEIENPKLITSDQSDAPFSIISDQPILSVSVLPFADVIKEVLAGSSGVEFTSYQFDPGSSEEDVQINSVRLELRATDVTGINTCQLFEGGTALNTGTRVVNPDPSTDPIPSPPPSPSEPILPPIDPGGGATIWRFTFDKPWIIPKGATKIANLKCNIASSATIGATFSWGLNGLYVDSVFGVTSGQEASQAVTSSSGPVIKVLGVGSLSVSLDPSNSNRRIVAAGTSNVPVTILGFSAHREAMELRQIAFQLGGSRRPEDIVKATIWDGATKVGETVFVGFNKHATSTLLSGVIVPKDGFKLLTVKVDLSRIGINEPAKAGDIVAIDFDADSSVGTYGVGLDSAFNIYPIAAGDTQSSGVLVYKSFPTLAKLAVPSNTLANGAMILYRFSVTASPAGDVGLGKFTFVITSSHAGISNFTLGGFSDSAFSVPAYVASSLNTPAATSLADGSVEIYFNPVAKSNPEAIQIPAGTTRYFELWGAVVNAVAGDSVSVALLGDANPTPLAGFNIVNSSSDDDFIWSGNSTTTSTFNHSDWSNGYLINGLPSISMSPEVLSK